MEKRRLNLFKTCTLRCKPNIQKRNEHFARITNKRRKKVVFQLWDWVWVNFRKIKFPHKVKSKLYARGDVPFQILERINDNAYVVDLSGDCNVSCTFNVSNLSLFECARVGTDLRINHSQEGKMMHLRLERIRCRDLRSLEEEERKPDDGYVAKMVLRNEHDEQTNGAKTPLGRARPWLDRADSKEPRLGLARSSRTMARSSRNDHQG